MPDTLFHMWMAPLPARIPLAEQGPIASPALRGRSTKPAGPKKISAGHLPDKDKIRHVAWSRGESPFDSLPQIHAAQTKRETGGADLPLDIFKLKVELSCPNPVRR
jgi:hypothetical protein